ncbi:MAG: DAK2 domain-containing protein [Clostridia bacterium]|nr:DAK2 domain-containing protein [Clostridia bacterium]
MDKELTHNEHITIDGNDYKNLIINAAKCLEDNKEEINELNVFPVPDGDTGSNMSMTVANAAKELLNTENMPLDKTAEATAKAMLHGARGNSGVIVSLLFRGIAKGLKSSFECDGEVWAQALEQGVEAAYKAVDNPAEGTILTVARKSAESAKNAAQENNNFEYVLSAAIEAAEKALEETVNQNPVLSKAGVVDAGGMGWLLVIKAMYQALTDERRIKYEPKSAVNTTSKSPFDAFETEDITFAFCTEFIITKNDPNRDTTKLKKFLSNMGDSLVMIDDGEIVKVHVHTNDPHRVLGEAQKYGIYETVKVENMRTQHTNKLVEAANEPEKDYGFISVCSGDGFVEIFRELGVDEVVSGGQTMNPATEDLCDAVSKINAKTIYILPNNKNIIMTASQVADITGKNVIVIPTKTVPQGVSAMLGFDGEADEGTNTENMQECMKNVSTMQITYAARNSSYDGMDIKEGDYLALCEDKLLFSTNNMNEIFEAFANKIAEEKKSFISIYYGENLTEEEAEEQIVPLREELEKSGAEINLYKGNQPVYYYIISAE